MFPWPQNGIDDDAEKSENELCVSAHIYHLRVYICPHSALLQLVFRQIDFTHNSAGRSVVWSVGWSITSAASHILHSTILPFTPTSFISKKGIHIQKQIQKQRWQQEQL